jgi:hypothetical protein
MPHSQRRPPARIGVMGAASRPTVPAVKPPASDLLDNPELKLDAPPDPGFDPYNTGTFNRGGSWEKINKRRSG